MDFPFKKVEELPEFRKDLKNLKKKYRTLDDDLDIFITVQLNAYHNLNQDVAGITEISDLGFQNTKIYKATRFACRSLKGSGSNSGIRVIYCHTSENKIELIEMYYKGDKESEDRNRIYSHYSE